jgi:hypothetical protein
MTHSKMAELTLLKLEIGQWLILEVGEEEEEYQGKALEI